MRIYMVESIDRRDDNAGYVTHGYYQDRLDAEHKAGEVFQRFGNKETSDVRAYVVEINVIERSNR